MDTDKRKFKRNTSENIDIAIIFVIVIILHLSYGFVRVILFKIISERH